MILEKDIINKGLEFRRYLEECRANGIKPEKTWENIIVEIGAEVAAETFRKKISTIWNNNKEERMVESIDDSNSGILNEYQMKLLELDKKKAFISDERIQLGAYKRYIARTETLGEIAKECANRIAKEKPFVVTSVRYNNKEEKFGICQISDWHYGEVVDNFTNQYNTEIAKQRIRKLTEQFIKYGKFHDIKTVYLVNLGDLFSGVIHLRLRLETRETVIDQIMQVSELLANMIYELSKHFNIEYYAVLDNHSRVDPSKKDSLELESFARIINWYLKSRFEKFDNVKINTNNLGEDICTFNILDYKYGGVHGDHDSPQKVVGNLSMITRDFYDVIITSHLHHFNCDEQNETVVISNGSLMGSNNYSKQLRLTSKATQNFIVVSKESPCEAIYRLILN